MAERLNAHDSKSCYAGMYTRVQIPFSAPNKYNPNSITPIGEGFGFLLYKIYLIGDNFREFFYFNSIRNGFVTNDIIDFF